MNVNLAKTKGRKVYSLLHICTKDDSAHQQIFRLPGFRGLTFFQIYHSDTANDLWKGATTVNKKSSVYQQLTRYWDNQPLTTTTNHAADQEEMNESNPVEEMDGN